MQQEEDSYGCWSKLQQRPLLEFAPTNRRNVHRVAPAHCTGQLVFKILQDTYANDYVYAGLGETISF
jgi:metal-dependent hydrolase (beta-lactamase superfamily II)